MLSKWKVFKGILYFSLILSLLTFICVIIFLIRFYQFWEAPTGDILFLLFLIPFFPLSFFLLWILKKKFPTGLITNKIQGTAYFLSIFVFIDCLFFIVYDSFFINAILKITGPPNIFIIFLVCFVIETLILAALYIYIGINAFLLISTIAKNRAEAFQKISEIGNS